MHSIETEGGSEWEKNKEIERGEEGIERERWKECEEWGGGEK